MDILGKRYKSPSDSDLAFWSRYGVGHITTRRGPSAALLTVSVTECDVQLHETYTNLTSNSSFKSISKSKLEARIIWRYINKWANSDFSTNEDPKVFHEIVLIGHFGKVQRNLSVCKTVKQKLLMVDVYI